MKLPQVKPKQVVKVLKKEGFLEVRRTGSHRHFHHPKCLRTQVSVHPKPMFKGTLNTILHQSEIPKEKFIKLLK